GERHAVVVRPGDPPGQGRVVGVEPAAQPGPRQLAGDLRGARTVARRYRHDGDLIGREPRRQRGAVMLEHHADEALDRAEQRAVQHHDVTALAARVDV